MQFILQKDWVPDILDGDAVKFYIVAAFCLSDHRIDEPYCAIADKEDFLQKHKKDTDRYYIIQIIRQYDEVF